MASDFTKGVIAGALLGGGSGSNDKRTVEELRRQNQLSEEQMRREHEWRRYQAEVEQERRRGEQEQSDLLGGEIRNQFAALEKLSGTCRKQQEQLEAIQVSQADVENNTNEHLVEVRNTLDQLLYGVGQIHQVLVRSQLAALPIDPRYLVNRFPPSELYDEYLGSGETLSATNFCLPRSWIEWLERGFTKPTDHCLFVCSDYQALPKIVDLLSKDRGDGIHRVVLPYPETPAHLGGALTKLDANDLLILVDERGLLPEIMLDCLSRALRQSSLYLMLDKGMCAHPVLLHLPKFYLYFVTNCVTTATNPLSATFPQEQVIANVWQVYQTATVGQIGSVHDLRLDYQASSKLMVSARELNLMPEAFTEIACRERPELVRELAAGSLSLGDFVGKF